MKTNKPSKFLFMLLSLMWSFIINVIISIISRRTATHFPGGEISNIPNPLKETFFAIEGIIYS